MGLIRFLASPTGRIARVAVGLVLIIGGPAVVGGAGGVILAVVGLVPLLAGLFDVCIFAPLAGLPVSGRAIRKQATGRAAGA